MKRSHNMTLRFALAASVLICRAYDANSQPRAGFTGNIGAAVIFRQITPDRHSFVRAEFAARPSNEDMAEIYPDKIAGGLAANLSCSLRKDMHLDHCRIDESAPISAAVTGYVLKVSKLLVLDRMGLSGRLDEVKAVELYISVDDGRLSADGHRPCLAPLCNVIPPPPPPR